MSNIEWIENTRAICSELELLTMLAAPLCNPKSDEDYKRQLRAVNERAGYLLRHINAELLRIGEIEPMPTDGTARGEAQR